MSEGFFWSIFESSSSSYFSKEQKPQRTKSSETAASRSQVGARSRDQGRDSPIVKHYPQIKNACFVTCVNLPYVVKVKNCS
jgi:hypothetical protein